MGERGSSTSCCVEVASFDLSLDPLNSFAEEGW